MRLIVGLGNPGPEYAWSRHNAGWMVVDAVAEKFGMGTPAVKFSSLFWQGRLPDGEKVLCAKPVTFMNLSGVAVREMVAYHRLAPERILVLYDDVALPFGQLRLRGKGSSGGHNGMASVLGALGTLEVPRLRVGVGPLPAGWDLVSFVLGAFPRDQREAMPDVADRGVRAVDLWIAEGLEGAMGRVNGAGKVQG